MFNEFLLSSSNLVESKATRCREHENGKPVVLLALGSNIYKCFERRIYTCVAFILNECSRPPGDVVTRAAGLAGIVFLTDAQFSFYFY